MGIVNGTTNYILTRMTEEGVSYHEALAEAQSLGYAERDPTADVEGFDAGAKAAIIASIAFGVRVVAGDVYHEGISGITAADIAFAKRLGYVVKLLAIVESSRRRRSACACIRRWCRSAIRSPACARATTRCSSRARPSATSCSTAAAPAAHPTASAVLGDLIDAATNLRKGSSASVGSLVRRRRIRPIDEATSEYYLNLEVADRPGVLAAVAGVFGATTCRSARWSRKGSATRPASSSSRTPRAKPTCRRRCTTCATSTSSTASARCCE